jgi:hypothetical protein
MPNDTAQPLERAVPIDLTAKRPLLIALNHRWRVRLIDNPPQWVLERSKVVKGALKWDGQSWCQYKTTLIRCIREKITHADRYYINARPMPVDQTAMAMVNALPVRA